MKLLLTLLLLVLAISGTKAQSFMPATLDPVIRQMMTDFDVPGLSLGIIRNDSVLFCKGYGTRETGKQLPVDENTLFGVGSISKSFTALTLAILVDEGKLDWDDKVVKHLPWFKMYDPWVTANITVRDLLTHRSGLRDVSGGTLWYHSDYSREEVVRRLQYLKPVSGFRDKIAYQNVMYIVASEIVREITGISWDQFLKTRVLDRIDMPSSTTISTRRDSSPNLSKPHIYNLLNKKTAIRQEEGDNAAPAGFLFSSAREMTNYMKLLLNKGVWGKDTIVRWQALGELFNPQVIFPWGPYHNKFTGYGFGWWLTSRNEVTIIDHSGGIDGTRAFLAMVPEMKFGVVVFCNTSERVTMSLASKILSMALKDPSIDCTAKAKSLRLATMAEAKLQSDKLKKSKIKSTRLSLPLNSYTGTYRDEAYGDILVRKFSNSELAIIFTHSKIFMGRMKQWHWDTFQVTWNDFRIPDGFVTFQFNAKHEITGFTIDEPNLLDVDFRELNITRVSR